MLHVHQGKDFRHPITSAVFELFHEALRAVVMQNALSDKPVLLEVLHTSFSQKSKLGIIHCMTNKTRGWFIQAISTLEVVDVLGAKLTFKAWTPMDADSSRPTTRGLRTGVSPGPPSQGPADGALSD